MIKVKQLYVVFEDESGHSHLIPSCEYRHFEKALNCIDDSFDEHQDLETYFEELNDLLEAFSDGTLEGELHYVVLDEHVVEGD